MKGMNIHFLTILQTESKYISVNFFLRNPKKTKQTRIDFTSTEHPRDQKEAQQSPSFNQMVGL